MRLSSSRHRTISTLHTNSACEVPNRLFLFRAQPFMVADSLRLAISQRLVKKLCPRCAIEEPLPPEGRLVRVGIKPEWLAGVSSVRRGRKCDFCRKTGVSGRKAIFEALIVDDEVKIAIQERAPTLHLQRILERRGEVSLFEKAVREAAAGVISLDEACKFREWVQRSRAGRRARRAVINVVLNPRDLSVLYRRDPVCWPFSNDRGNQQRDQRPPSPKKTSETPRRTVTKTRPDAILLT